MAQPLALSQLLPKQDSNVKTYLEPTSQRNLPTRKSKAALEVIGRYGEAPQFLVTFNPDRQVAYTKDLRKVFLGQAPKLGVVRSAYGDETVESWVEIQLYNLSEFAGCKEKLTVPQMDETARMIIECYGYLNVAELMLFFQKFKRCEYGKFYGSVDPMVILGALSDFCAERRHRLSQYESEERDKANAAEEAARNADKAEYASRVDGAFADDCPITYADWSWGHISRLTDKERITAMPRFEKLPKLGMERYNEMNDIVSEIISRRE